MAYKTFANGFPLPASDLNNFLMNQSVIVFADSAARTSAIPSPVEGMLTYLEDTNAYESWNGSAYVAIAPVSPITTQGDLITGDASGVASRIAIGTDDQVLKVAAGVPTWVDGGGGGIQTLVNFPFEILSIKDVDFPRNSIVRFAIVTTTDSPFSFVLADSAGNNVSMIEVDRNNPFTYYTAGTAIAKIQAYQNVVDEEVQLIYSEPTAGQDADLVKDVQIITTTQSITLSKSFDVFAFGGGGGGGNNGGFQGSAAGGGGSGYLATGTLVAGTYTATIGAGGSTDSVGGTTSVGAISAAGGQEGENCVTTNLGGDGGNGGSGGGGGGAGFNSPINGGDGGINGGNGAVGSFASPTSSASDGGTGSTIQSSTTFVEIFQHTPIAPRGVANSSLATAKFYSGGPGGLISLSNPGTNASGFAGGGQGAAGRGNTGSALNDGGTGFQGYILLVEA